MKYSVCALVSRSFDKVYFPGQPWRKHCVLYGPYRRLANAKRAAARMRQERVIVDRKDGVKDYGPNYTRVWIDKVDDNA